MININNINNYNKATYPHLFYIFFLSKKHKILSKLYFIVEFFGIFSTDAGVEHLLWQLNQSILREPNFKDFWT